MKKIVVALVAVLLMMGALPKVSAQGFYTGIRGGLNVTGVTDRPNSKAKVGGNVGLMGGFQFSSILAIQAEVLYSFQGYFSGNNYLGLAPASSMICLDYIKVPILAKLYLIKGLNIEAGVSFNFLTSALVGTRPIKGYNSFDFSIPIGLAYRFGRHFEIGARYDISTVKVDPSVTGNNSVFSVNVSWRF